MRMVSLLGVVAMLALAWGISKNRRAFPWRVVVWGLALQVVFALVILKTQLGFALFDGAQQVVLRLGGFAQEGMKQVFGSIADPAFLGEKWGQGNAVVLAFAITGMIILVSALSSLLYHFGILQRVVGLMARVMQSTMRTSGSESLAAAANIVMGQTEAPLVVRPYLKGMTQSELMALMTGGMATIAGGVLAVYVLLGASAGHLLTASVMSAPAALMISKIIWPETEASETSHGTPAGVGRETTNGMEALVRGASDGLMLSLNVMAMLIAFVALVAMANWLLGQALRPFGVAMTWQELLGYLNAPFAWLMGVPAKDCLAVGQLLGERIVLNEFVSYLSLTSAQATLDKRSFDLATYALCGFANIGSVAIQIGGIGTLAPERRADLAKLGFRAMVAGLLACYLTTSIVGVLL
jgi:CNT family concentrative nucleoside transporter